MSPPDRAHGRRLSEPPGALDFVPSMISPQERALLRQLAAEVPTVEHGRIVDAGAFLGSSTLALAEGVLSRPAPPVGRPIVVYDRFRAEPYMVDGGYFEQYGSVAAGDDIRPLFERNVASVADLLEIRPGQIEQLGWSGEPIVLLFLDLLESWEVNDAVVAAFFGRLVPGALIVQQDYHYSTGPWLALTMERFADRVERVAEAEWATVAFRVIESLGDTARLTPSRRLPRDEQLRLLDRAVEREPSARGAAMVRLNRAVLREIVRRPGGDAEIAAVRDEHADDAGVLAAADYAAATIARIAQHDNGGPPLQPGVTSELGRLRPWRVTTVPPAVGAVPSMLSDGERSLLIWTTAEYWTGRGRVIDAGCFLGGSSIALAAGMRERRAQEAGLAAYGNDPIVVYDRFVVEQYALAQGFFAEDPLLSPGDSFRSVFERHVAPVRDLLDVREGDILAARWGEPIEILFLDVLKSWAINDYVVGEFWPSLVPGALVIQQDYQYGGYPWLAITMERLSDYFERLDEIPWGTVLFRLREPLPDLSALAPSRALPAREKLRLMDRAVARETTLEGRGMLRLSRALLLAYIGRRKAAVDEVHAVAGECSHLTSVLGAAVRVATYVGSRSAVFELSHNVPALRPLRRFAP